MIRLKVVKTAEEEASNQEEADNEDDHLPHGAQVLKYLVLPWANSDRVICADSYFASVTAALEMKQIGLRFIGVIKTATRRFPMAYLQGLELEKRGDRTALIKRRGGGWGIHRYFCLDGSRTAILHCKWIQFARRLRLQSHKVETTGRRGVAREGGAGSATASCSRDLFRDLWPDQSKQSASTSNIEIGAQVQDPQLERQSQSFHLWHVYCRYLTCLQPVHPNRRRPRSVL
jgi:Transposase IS4